jgi:hypothetical protein
VKWYRKAAEQGDAEAQCKFGQAYAEGMGTLLPDKNMARIWLQKSAHQGYQEAKERLLELDSKVPSYTEIEI